MDKFKGKLGTYTYLKTEDGSYTIHSEAFDENCHSTSGAYEETLYNYVHGCEIIEKLRDSDSLTIFEVGFGAGLGPIATYESIEAAGLSDREIDFYTTEIDPEMAKWVVQSDEFKKRFPFENMVIDGDNLNLKAGNFNLTILIGDARKTITTLINSNILTNAIYQDPFSQKKNPSLWTLEWFKDLRKISHPDVIMSTYSSSLEVRKGMLDAGFYIEKKAGFAAKRSATRAKLIPIHNQENILSVIDRSGVKPYRD